MSGPVTLRPVRANWTGMQWTTKDDPTFPELIEWLSPDQKWFDGHHLVLVFAHRGKGFGGQVVVEQGQWVLRDPDGHISVANYAEVARRFRLE